MATKESDTNEPRYPDVLVKVLGEDGNGFAIVSRTMAAMRQAGVPQRELDEYQNEATSKNYDHLLMTTMDWVSAY